MRGIGRWASLRVLSVVVAVAAAGLLPATGASASVSPVPMHYACALTSTGLMRYVTAPAQCASNETSVKIDPGPHYVCVHPNKTVHLVAALSDCVPPQGVQAITLPSPNGRVHFCAANGTDVLTYVTFPGKCTSSEFPVVVWVVPHQPPVLANIEPGTLQYGAGTAAVPVTSSLTVSSPDVRSLAGATVTISTGLVPSEDSLSFTNQNGITGSYDSGTGVLTLTGTSRVANYQAALRSVTFSVSAGATPPTGTRTISFQVSDGHAHSNLSNVVSRDIMVNSSPPVISNVEPGALSYRAQDPAVPITSTLTLTDADDATISGATVSVTSGFSSGADSLSFTNQNGITGSYDSTTGVLTLSGSAAITDYQAALRSVQFFTSDGAATPAARTVSFTVTDSLGATSAPAQRTINVGEANQPPVAVNQSYTAVGNTPLGVGTSPPGPAATIPGGSVLTGDSDPDSPDPISVTGNSTPAHGTVSMNPNGTFTYVPAAGYSGLDSFQYTVTDSDDPGNPLSATATVSITVGPVVWYVDNSQTAAGTGESTSPFNTLAAANSAAGTNSIIFLYQGNATYTGGVSMKSGEDLWGQPNGLTVGGYSLVSAGGSTPTITNSGGDGIDLAENADVEGVNVASPSGNGIAASGVNDATVGSSTPVAISGAGSDGIHISGGSGTLDFAGTSVTGSAGHSVLVTGRAGGTSGFGGSITDHGTGISLTGNSGATINFGGTLTLSTGSSGAFTATGGGTVSATGSGSTISTSTGIAVNVQNTTIGSGGLTFQSVSSNGANPGIALASTGASGGLTVTGTGSAGSGGTIQGSAGEGIQLSSTSSPSFTDMVIKNNAADGINGSQVNGLTLAGSTVSGNGTQANVSGENNDGLDFSPNGTGSPNGLTGTVSISNSTITGSADNNAVISDTSGTLNLTVTGSTFSNENATTGNDGIHVDANGSTNATVSITGSTFTNNFGDHFQFSTSADSTGTNSVTFSNNTLSSTVSGILGGGVVISPFGNSHTTMTIDTNNIQNSVFSGIAIDENGASGTLSGTVHGNTVGTPTVTNSGGGNAIGIFAEGSVTETLAITGNNLYQYQNDAGISYLSREGSPVLSLTITGNTIANPGQFGSWGILGDAGALPTDGGTVCAAISGNSMTGSAQPGQGGADFELDQVGTTTYKLPGYTGGSGDTNAVVGFVQSNNGGTPSGIATVSGSGGGFTGGTSCPAPS